MTLSDELDALLSGETDLIATLANASAFLWMRITDLNWAGFYLYHAADDCLVLGPFQGKPACTRIALTRGVCGASFTRNETLRVADVHSFAGHIACDGASNSELVVPLRDETGRPFGVLDLDSPMVSRFTEADQAEVETLARIIEKAVWSSLAIAGM